MPVTRRQLNCDFVRDGLGQGFLDPLFTFTRASSATRFNASGVLETVGSNVPRFDFDPATLACRGLLIEEQRTNLCLMSGDITQSPWSYSGSAVAAVETVNGIPLCEYTSLSSDGSFNQSFTPASGATYACSFYARVTSGTRTFNIYLYRISPFTIIEVVSITLTTTLQRFVVSGTALDATSHVLQIGGANTLPNGASIRVGGFQIEAGPFPTSYTPTTSAAVTRASDYCTASTLIPWMNSDAGTYFAEYSSPESTFVPWANASDGFLRVLGGSLRFTPVGGSALVNGSYTPGNIQKAAYSHGGGRIAGVADGGTVASALATPGAPTKLDLGSFGAIDDHINGHLRRFVYLPFAADDLTLKALTQ